MRGSGEGGGPGDELHLPPGTVIRDRAGKVVTRVSLTPVPLDRPPFALAQVPVPIYFTAQPGQVSTLNSARRRGSVPAERRSPLRPF